MATLGEATDLQRSVHAVSIEVSRRMTEALRPGLTCSDLFIASRKAVDEVASGMPGLEWFGQVRMGHGQGLMVTEPPSICPEDDTELEPGMVISTEPGVQSGDVQFTWEDVHVITEDGSEQITDETTELQLGVHSPGHVTQLDQDQGQCSEALLAVNDIHPTFNNVRDVSVEVISGVACGDRFHGSARSRAAIVEVERYAVVSLSVFGRRKAIVPDPSGWRSI